MSLKIFEREVGVAGGFNLKTVAPKIIADDGEPCDVGFMGKVSVGSGVISVEFEILEIHKSEFIG